MDDFGGYKSYLISTIVDLCFSSWPWFGYKSYLISTIVDLLLYEVKQSQAISLI